MFITKNIKKIKTKKAKKDLKTRTICRSAQWTKRGNCFVHDFIL